MIRELYTITGMELWMYTFSDFLHTAKKLLSTSVDNEVLEEVKEIEKEKLHINNEVLEEVKEIEREKSPKCNCLEGPTPIMRHENRFLTIRCQKCSVLLGIQEDSLDDY